MRILLTKFVQAFGRICQLMRRSLDSFRQWLKSHELFQLWFKESKNLFIEVIAFNLFAFLIVNPVLRRMFPPLSGWEKFKEVFTGSARLTYMEIAPITAKVIWIIGNGFLLAMIHRRLSRKKFSPSAEAH